MQFMNTFIQYFLSDCHKITHNVQFQKCKINFNGILQFKCSFDFLCVSCILNNTNRTYWYFNKRFKCSTTCCLLPWICDALIWCSFTTIKIESSIISRYFAKLTNYIFVVIKQNFVLLYRKEVVACMVQTYQTLLIIQVLIIIKINYISLVFFQLGRRLIKFKSKI